MASKGEEKKAAFSSAERSDKGQVVEGELISFRQSSRPPPSVALSLRTRESSALALKHIFDKLYSPAESESNNNGNKGNNNGNKGIASMKDHERRDYIEVEAYGRDRSNRAAGATVHSLGFQGCTDQEEAPAWRVSSSREENRTHRSEKMHGQGFHAHGKAVHVPNSESYFYDQDHQSLSRQATLHQAVMRTRPKSPPMSHQRTAQLTLFYAGTVYIYDDVPADKANAIMLLAGTGNPLLVSQSNEDERQGLGVKRNPPFAASMYTNKNFTVMKDPKGAIGEPVNAGTKSSLNSTAASDVVESIIPTAISSNRLLLTMETSPQHAAKEPQIGLPHARKASLARFMEKRRTGSMELSKFRSCIFAQFPGFDQ